jgi:hypothetical protein
MSTFQLLDQSQEDELHKSRLLNVEEKPFKRITKRILTPGALLPPSNLLATPPPDIDGTSALEAVDQKYLEERRQFREDVLLDFAAFDSSIARIQFLRNSNERERERYAAEKIKIMDAAQGVKDNTVQLRLQLEEAKKTLEQRKRFDELAEKITSNRLLRPREDQEVNLRKLEEECAELERESETYAVTWTQRSGQFENVMGELNRMQRQIRDEKEEVERREGMDNDEEDGEVGDTGSHSGATPKHSSQSGNATPRPDGASTPRPISASGGQTPAHQETSDAGNSDGLRLRPGHAGGLSGPESRAGSRNASPAGMDRRGGELEEGEDTAMDDAAVAGDTSPGYSGMPVPDMELPQVTIGAPDDSMDTT